MIDDKDISQTVLETIKAKNIAPTPKWTFLLKDYVVWGLGAISLLIGSLAIAVTVSMVRHNDWDLYKYASDSLLSFILVTLPYFWIAFLILFILAANYNFKHTKNGYRYRLSTIVAGSILISIAFGLLFYVAGLGQVIDKILVDKVPVYERIMEYRKRIWSQDERGLLSGVIVGVTDKEHFDITDPDRKIWHVTAHRVEEGVRPMLKRGARVKMVGEKVDRDKFNAVIIRPSIDKRTMEVYKFWKLNQMKHERKMF